MIDRIASSGHAGRALVIATSVALLAAVIVPSAALADVVPTTIVLSISDTTPDRGDPVTYVAMVTPAPGGTGLVEIETSTDGGGTWSWYQNLAFWSSAGEVQAEVTVHGSEPLGPRLVRATFLGATGFDGSVSDPVTQTISRRHTSVSGLKVQPGDESEAVVPDSSNVMLIAWVTGGAGRLVFEEDVDGTWSELGNADVTYDPTSSSAGWVYLTHGFPLGPHTLRARLVENAYSDPSEQTVVWTSERADPGLAFTAPAPATVQANHGFDLYVEFAGPTTRVAPTAELSLLDGANDAVLATVTGSKWLSAHVGPLALGAHLFKATYAGDGDFLPDTTTLTVNVVADAVDASGVGVSAGTFYPVRDGYRDTLSILGVRNEPASVAIRIYSSTGRLVRSASIAKNVDSPSAYRFAWNGRTSGGTLVAAGRYRIVQTLTDSGHATLRVTSYAWVSWKKLITKTATISRRGSSIAAKGTEGTGRIYVSTAGGYARITSGSSGIAIVGYAFTLPSAIHYRSLRFQAYAYGPGWSAPNNELGVQNFVTCPYSSIWHAGCFERWVGLGTRVGGPIWSTGSASVTVDRSGRTVRVAGYAVSGSIRIYTVRVKVSYQILG